MKPPQQNPIILLYADSKFGLFLQILFMTPRTIVIAKYIHRGILLHCQFIHPPQKTSKPPFDSQKDDTRSYPWDFTTHRASRPPSWT